MSWLSRERWRVATVLVALAVVVAGKQYYRDASAADLRWILAPTAQLVSWVTGHAFVYEAGQGWINTDVMFVIAPACAGVHFALAAFLALALGALAGMTSWHATGKRLARAALLAYAATLVVNPVRISRPTTSRPSLMNTFNFGPSGLDWISATTYLLPLAGTSNVVAPGIANRCVVLLSNVAHRTL